MQHARASFSLSVPRTRNTTISTRLLLFCISGIYIYIYTRLYIIIIPSLLPASFTSITMQLRNSVSTIYPNCASNWKCVETISLLSLRGMILSYCITTEYREEYREFRYSLKRYVENFFVDFNKLDRLNNLRILEKFNSEYTVYTSRIVNNTKFTK